MNIKDTVAAIVTGSAEDIIENNGVAIDGVDESVNRDLIQPSVADDAKNVAALFTSLRSLCTDEFEYTNRDTGEVVIGNNRNKVFYAFSNNIMRQFDWLKSEQRKAVARAAGSVDAINNQPAGERDNTLLASREAWLEQEEDRYLALVALERAMLQGYSEECGHAYQAQSPKSKASTHGAKAAALARLDALDKS